MDSMASIEIKDAKCSVDNRLTCSGFYSQWCSKTFDSVTGPKTSASLIAIFMLTYPLSSKNLCQLLLIRNRQLVGNTHGRRKRVVLTVHIVFLPIFLKGSVFSGVQRLNQSSMCFESSSFLVPLENWVKSSAHSAADLREDLFMVCALVVGVHSVRCYTRTCNMGSTLNTQRGDSCRSGH
jgi:hypothetical protein